jgi:hypothetical protein
MRPNLDSPKIATGFGRRRCVPELLDWIPKDANVIIWITTVKFRIVRIGYLRNEANLTLPKKYGWLRNEANLTVFEKYGWLRNEANLTVPKKYGWLRNEANLTVPKKYA